MVIWKQLRYIRIAFPEELLAQIDEAAKLSFKSRSDYIRGVLVEEINKTKQDTRWPDMPIKKEWLDIDGS